MFIVYFKGIFQDCLMGWGMYNVCFQYVGLILNTLSMGYESSRFKVDCLL